MENLPFVRFDAPCWLALLPVLLPLTWWIGRKSLAGLSRGRGACALALRLLLIAALVGALARPKWSRGSDAVAVYFVVDRSRSIPAGRMQDIRSRLAAFAKAKPADALSGLIYFGRDAACEMPPSKLQLEVEQQSVVNRDGTDIAAALRLAASTFPAHVRKRIVLFTDGNQNRGDATTAIRVLRSQGIRLDVVPVDYVHDREIILEKAHLPDRAQAGTPVTLRVIVNSTHETDALLKVRKGDLRLYQKAVHLTKGRTPFSLPVKLDEGEVTGGLQTFEITVSPLVATDDGIVENNTAYAFTRIDGPPSVLYVDGNLGVDDGYRPRLHAALLEQLRLLRRGENLDSPTLTLRLCDATAIPEETQLAAYDCIILDNVAAETIGLRRMRRIAALVNGQGMGLVMIGGENAFGVGNYRNTPIETALPVEMDLKNKKIMPNGALVLALDRSGSMTGGKLAQAKAAAGAAVSALSPSDYIGIVAFDSQPDWLVPLVLAQDRYAIRKRISALGPGGGTDILAALREAHQGLAAARASLKHIVVLSDGQSNRRGLPDLMADIARDGITVSSVGIGEATGQSLMRDIARHGGGRYYYAHDTRKLPRIFIRESRFVKRGLLFEETFTPAVTAENDAFLEPVAGDPLPPLHGYVATTAKQGAEVPLVSTNENRDPILAHWRYGLGRAVAFTSDAKNRWARDWLSWDGFANFWSNLVYRILRQEPAHLRLVATIEGRRGRIVVHALDDQERPMPFLNLQASISDPASNVSRVELRQTGVCTYEGQFPADASGRYEVAVTSQDFPAGAASAAYGGVAKPFSDECAALSADSYSLHQIASMGGGQVLKETSDPGAVYQREGVPPARQYADAWPLLLGLVAMLLPADVCLRRVMIDWAEIMGWLHKRYADRRHGTSPADQGASRLLAAKGRALRGRAKPAIYGGRAEGAPLKQTHVVMESAEMDAKCEANPSSVATAEASLAREETDLPEAEKETHMQRLLRAKKRIRSKY